MPARLSETRARKQRAAMQLDTAIKAAAAAHVGLVAALESATTTPLEINALLQLVDQALRGAGDSVRDVLGVEASA